MVKDFFRISSFTPPVLGQVYFCPQLALRAAFFAPLYG